MSDPSALVDAVQLLVTVVLFVLTFSIDRRVRALNRRFDNTLARVNRAKELVGKAAEALYTGTDCYLSGKVAEGNSEVLKFRVAMWELMGLRSYLHSDFVSEWIEFLGGLHPLDDVDKYETWHLDVIAVLTQLYWGLEAVVEREMGVPWWKRLRWGRGLQKKDIPKKL